MKLSRRWGTQILDVVHPARLIFVFAEFLFQIGCKFADAVCNDAHPGLRDYALISLNCDRGIIWIPGCSDCACSERRRKWHDIWPFGLFAAVIGYEVSNEGVTKAWPRSCAAATVIARLPSDDSLTKRGERVLNNIRGLVGAHAFGEAGETISPRRR